MIWHCFPHHIIAIAASDMYNIRVMLNAITAVHFFTQAATFVCTSFMNNKSLTYCPGFASGGTCRYLFLVGGARIMRYICVGSHCEIARQQRRGRGVFGEICICSSRHASIGQSYPVEPIPVCGAYLTRVVRDFILTVTSSVII